MMKKWIGIIVRKGLMGSRNASVAKVLISEGKNNMGQDWNCRHKLAI